MRTKAIMEQMRNSPNMEIALMNLLQSNSQLGSIVPLIRNGNSLEGIAKSIASMKGIDINQLIQKIEEMNQYG